MIALPSIAQRRAALERRFPVWPRVTLAAHFERACRGFAARPYFYLDDARVTYGAVWERAVEYAKAFLAMGVRHRDHVAVLMDNDTAFPALMVAASLVGAVFIPINAMLTEREMRYVVAQSDARFLIVRQRVKNRDYGRMAVEMLDSGASALARVICRESTRMPGVDDRATTWDAFLAGGEATSDAALQQRRDCSAYPDEVAIILYTSGSTGSPKGVMLTSDMLLRCAYSTCLSRAIEVGRVTFAPLPFYHCFAIVESILAMSFVGGAFISAPGASPLHSLELMEKFHANDYLCVPSMLLPLLDHPRVAQFDLSALFAMWCGAAPAPVSVWQRARDILGLREIVTGYGQTEVSSSGVITRLDDPLEKVASRVGRPKPGGVSGLPEFGGSPVEYRVIDRDTGAPLPARSVGELAVRGATVTRGYYRKPDETALAIDKDGWLRTGDVGRIDDDGYLQILGRSEEMYKVSGELVAPREVEIVLSDHPAVSLACVVGVPSARTTETGAAFVELRPDARCTRRALIDWCAARLTAYKVPRYVWFLAPGEWPMTGSGKVQKFHLREMAQLRRAHRAPAATRHAVPS